jgi:hypothetical protein
MNVLMTAVIDPDPSTAELDRLGDEIAELSAHLDAATARLLDLIREFDDRAGWNNGFRSCAAWLSWRVGYAPDAAREHVRVARSLGTLPLLSQALARGELSYAKVRELTRVATPETEARLLAVGRAGTAEHVERIVRGWRRMNRKAEAQEAARHHTARALHVYQDEDGAVRIRGRLAPTRRRWSSSRPMPWRCSPRLRSTRASIPAPRESGTRSLCTSMPRPGRRRPNRAVRARGRHARSGRNVAASGLRCNPGGHAPRRRGACDRSRGPNTHDPAGAAPRASASRSRLSLPRLRRALRPGPPHPSLGPRRPDAISSIASPTVSFDSGDRVANFYPKLRWHLTCRAIR